MAVLDDLDYADDIGLLSSKHQDDRQMAELLSKTANTLGLKVNTKKAQVPRKNPGVSDPVMIDGRHIENVEEFTYLGTIETTSGDCNLEINTLISKSNQAFAMLKPVWRVTNLSIHTKIKIIISKVLSVLLYGAECWKTSIAIQRELEIFQTKFLRRILKIYWSNTISNQELRNRTGMDTLVKIMQTWRWPWL